MLSSALKTWSATLLLSSCLAVPCLSADLRIGTNVLVKFATVEEGRAILGRSDEFIAALTPLDRRVRMKSEEEVSEEHFLAFVNQSVKPWTPAETSQVSNTLHAVRDKLAVCQELFPTNIWFIKTSGEEE